MMIKSGVAQRKAFSCASAEVSGTCIVASNEATLSRMHASALQPNENTAALLLPV